MPHRDRYLFVCTNRRADDNPKGSCAQKGSEEVVKALKAALLRRGATGRLRRYEQQVSEGAWASTPSRGLGGFPRVLNT